MRLLFCKIHCPSFICFCKPSSLSPPPLEKNPNVLETLTPFPDSSSELSNETIEEEKKKLDEIILTSSLKKPSLESTNGVGKNVEKRRVHWVDSIGQELVQIKEFEPSESGDSDDEDNVVGGCVCVIQ